MEDPDISRPPRSSRVPSSSRGGNDTRWHRISSMEGAPFAVAVSHATRSMGVVIAAPPTSGRTKTKEAHQHDAPTPRLRKMRDASTSAASGSTDSARNRHRYSPVFLHELGLRAKRQQAEDRENQRLREDAMVAGFDDFAATLPKVTKPGLYDEQTGKLNAHFADGSDAFERAQRPAPDPTAAAAALLLRPPFIPVGRVSVGRAHARAPSKPPLVSPRPSPALMALRKSAALKPARGPPPRNPPDPNGIWGVSYLGRRGGPIETCTSHALALSDEAYQRTAAAVQESIELARQAMERPTPVEPSPADEGDQRTCRVRITIAHSRAAATWRTPWRVQMHCEVEGGAVRQAWEAEAEAEAEPQPLAEEEAQPQDDDEHEHKAREEPRVPPPSLAR